MTAVVFLISDILFKAVGGSDERSDRGGFAWFWYGLPLSRKPGGAARAR